MCVQDCQLVDKPLYSPVLSSWTDESPRSNFMVWRGDNKVKQLNTLLSTFCQAFHFTPALRHEGAATLLQETQEENTKCILTATLGLNPFP